MVVLILVAVIVVFSLNPTLPRTANIRIIEAQPGMCPANDTIACGFNPSTSKIAFGGLVIWFNNDKLNHTITWGNQANGLPWGLPSSGPVAPQAAYIISSIKVGGTLSHRCSIHPWMTGTLIVQ